jgi:hypothetical protein
MLLLSLQKQRHPTCPAVPCNEVQRRYAAVTQTSQRRETLWLSTRNFKDAAGVGEAGPAVCWSAGGKLQTVGKTCVYTLSCPGLTRMHNTFHVDLLESFVTPSRCLIRERRELINVS